jgi:predicted nucleic acid-binding protein
VAAGIIVPDASVLLKWVLRDPDEEERTPALALRGAWLDGDVELLVPTLWVYEVGNVLGLKQPATAGKLLAAMIDLRLPEQTAASYAEAIVDLMRSYGVTFYDAAYHALAVVRGGTMLTADRRYATKCYAAGHVRAIGDWQRSS